MKTIAFVDLFWEGHHATYLKLYSKIALELGYRVLVFCLEKNEMEKWGHDNLSTRSEYFYVYKIKNKYPLLHPGYVSSKFFSSMLKILGRWINISNLLKKNRYCPDLTFFCWMDSYLINVFSINLILDRIFPYKWSGLYFQPMDMLIPKKKYLQNIFFNRNSIFKSRYCAGVGILIENIKNKLQLNIKRKPVIVFPDIVDVKNSDDYYLIKEIKKKAKKRKIIGLLGSLGKWKGMLSLLEVARISKERNWFFIFVGQLEKESFTKEELYYLYNCKKSFENIFFHFERIPNESEFNSSIKICDALFAVYENFRFSSNILTKSAFFKIPVIVSKNYCMGERVRKYNLGKVVEESSPLECYNALNEIFVLNNLKDNSNKFKFEEYKEHHSIEKQKSIFTRLMEFK